jgi:Tfp pilus assembly protein PilE
VLRRRRARSGLTLVELCLVLAVIALTMKIATRQLAMYLDRAAARSAVADAAMLVVRARDEAVAQRALVTVRVDSVADALELRERGAVVSRAALGHAHGVAVAGTSPGGPVLLVDEEGPIAVAEGREGAMLKPTVGFRSA